MSAEEFMIEQVRAYFAKMSPEERKAVEEEVKYHRDLPNDYRPPYEHKPAYQHGLDVIKMLPDVEVGKLTYATMFDDCVDDALRICRESLY